jgi:outer membrane protein TolC
MHDNLPTHLGRRRTPPPAIAQRRRPRPGATAGSRLLPAAAPAAALLGGAALAAALLLAPPPLRAQAPAGGAPATQATPLPLSGRGTASGSVAASETAVPGTTSSVDTLNPSLSIAGAYSGSVTASGRPFAGRLSLREAVERGLDHNLGAVGLTQAVRQARGQSRAALSALLPNLSGDFTGTEEKVDLAAFGFGSLRVPGFALPSVVGPFHYFDLRARLSQTVLDLVAWNNFRSAAATLRANELAMRDARSLIVLGVGGAYLQTRAAQARLEAARARLLSARTFHQQTAEQRSAGVVSQLDVNRAQVQELVEQQRLTTLDNDFAKQKINLARMIGLPPNDQYDLVDDVPFAAAPPIALGDALREAAGHRADLQEAGAQVQAAELALAAARGERLPALSLNADYGRIGTTPSQAQPTFTVVGMLHVPIWEGGRTGGHVEAAAAALAQRRAEQADLGAEVEAEVRRAFLDVQAAASQVDVAERNLEVNRQSLDLTRQRFAAGVTDNLEVVQTEEALAAAELDRINSLFAHNLAKLNLARAVGRADASGLSDFLRLP